LLLPAQQVQAQSFDYNNASTVAEHPICDDPQLRRADGRLGSELKNALRVAPDQRKEPVGGGAR
jgi:uncharacterized protein